MRFVDENEGERSQFKGAPVNALNAGNNDGRARVATRKAR
jgi:hypothetical protein